MPISSIKNSFALFSLFESLKEENCNLFHYIDISYICESLISVSKSFKMQSIDFVCFCLQNDNSFVGFKRPNTHMYQTLIKWK